MEDLWNWLGNTANLIGILSAIFAIIAWCKTKKHAREVQDTLQVIQNYKKVEIYTEVTKKMEKIKSEIRGISQSNAANFSKRYVELEKTVGEIIHLLPSKESELIINMQDIEKKLRISADKNKKLIDQELYDFLDLIEVSRTRLKILMEELKKEN